MQNIIIVTVLSLLVLPAGASGQTPGSDSGIKKDHVGTGQEEYSPHLNRDYPDRVLWGDTHLHTSISMDARGFGNSVGLDEAYRFAMGETVTSATGTRVKLLRPLDFLVVADHSDNMGFFDDLLIGAPHIISDPTGKDWYERSIAGDGASVALEIMIAFSAGRFPDALVYSPDSPPYKDVWDRIITAAEKFNDPGKFTAFIGYEWTSLVAGNNLHRVVIYRDGANKSGRSLPYTTTQPLGSPDPKDLWLWMRQYEDQTGGNVLAIAHNGNLSNGVMFPMEVQFNGNEIDGDYVAERIRWEPLYEITQMKGDGETHPLLSPNDEFADYETWDLANLESTVAKTPEMLPAEYGREALKRGLLLESTLGTNPYKFGLIGSTDSHTSLATVREDNFFGKMSTMEPQPNRLIDPLMATDVGTVYYRDVTASGLAAVWAEDNTRGSLFDAMRRKETYATTGSRITVRVFGGWDFTANEVEQHNFVDIGYSRGVPMGGDLTNGPAGKAPTLLIHALRDPDNANLDRVQVIKGWLGNNGSIEERIYDVACSDGREIVERRCEREVGSTVNVADASYTNTIGDPLLTAHWVDPDFDPGQRAFYYVRVIEIPKPRWTAYDAKYFGLNAPDDTVMTVQDRAYTSPIWYTP